MMTKEKIKHRVLAEMKSKKKNITWTQPSTNKGLDTRTALHRPLKLEKKKTIIIITLIQTKLYMRDLPQNKNRKPNNFMQSSMSITAIID